MIKEINYCRYDSKIDDLVDCKARISFKIVAEDKDEEKSPNGYYSGNHIIEASMEQLEDTGIIDSFWEEILEIYIEKAITDSALFHRNRDNIVESIIPTEKEKIFNIGHITEDHLNTTFERLSTECLLKYPKKAKSIQKYLNPKVILDTIDTIPWDLSSIHKNITSLTPAYIIYGLSEDDRVDIVKIIENKNTNISPKLAKYLLTKDLLNKVEKMDKTSDKYPSIYNKLNNYFLRLSLDFETFYRENNEEINEEILYHIENYNYKLYDIKRKLSPNNRNNC